MAEAAEEGDEEALEELRADRVEAIEAMIGALEDPASRKLVELGMTLAGLRASDGDTQGTFNVADSIDDLWYDGAPVDVMLDGVGEQLQAQISFPVPQDGIRAGDVVDDF